MGHRCCRLIGQFTAAAKKYSFFTGLDFVSELYISLKHFTVKVCFFSGKINDEDDEFKIKAFPLI